MSSTHVSHQPQPFKKRAAYLGEPVDIMFRYPLYGCDIWYVRFSLDNSGQMLALGNQEGKLFVWDLRHTNCGARPRRVLLDHKKCTKTIRQTCFSADGRTLLAVCEDGSVWRWELDTR
eukprot:m.115383 g.115383  ORF g.115383 m.115383 type:complete len:118 (-) comp16342_c0_seq2:47-400(-)